MLRVAYISSPTEKPQRLTAKEKLRREAIASLAVQKIQDRERAKKLFEKELQALEALEKKYGITPQPIQFNN